VTADHRRPRNRLRPIPGLRSLDRLNQPVHTYDGGVTWSDAYSPGERSIAILKEAEAAPTDGEVSEM